MKRRIYLVRHAESQSNAGGILAGPETPLSARGIEQAQTMAARVAKLPIDTIISSSMLRARQTAQFIAEATRKPISLTSDLFAERRYPKEQHGLTAQHPEVIRIEKIVNNHFGEADFRHSDEENFEDLKSRVLKALAVLDERTEENVLLVSHGMFLRMLMAAVLFGADMTGHEAAQIVKGFKSQNTGLSILEKNPDDKVFSTDWRVFVWNDHAHLA